MAHIALPEGLPGIRGPMAFRPETAKPLNDLVNVLLHEPHSLSAGERELIATYVSSQNDCYFCQTIHGAIAAHHLGGDGELVQKVGQVPDGIRVIVSGVAQLTMPGEQGAQIPVTQLKKDDLLGVTALTRQPVALDVMVVDELAVLFVPIAIVDTLVKTRPALARDIGLAIDHRQQLSEKAAADAGMTPGPGSLVYA